MEEEQRIVELETKIAHQDIALEELQKAVFDYHLRIEQLEKGLKRLIDRFDATVGDLEVGPGNEKPPHY